jgi:hypothetical protein
MHDPWTISVTSWRTLAGKYGLKDLQLGLASRAGASRSPWPGCPPGGTSSRWTIADRDTLLSVRIAAACDALGLRWARIDGSLDLDDSIALLEQHVGPQPPSQPNV